MKYRKLAGVFAILCILLYLAYAYWGLSSSAVLVLSVISGIAALLCIAMMFIRPKKTGSGPGVSSN